MTRFVVDLRGEDPPRVIARMRGGEEGEGRGRALIFRDLLANYCAVLFAVIRKIFMWIKASDGMKPG